jgi:hypothetical protein
VVAVLSAPIEKTLSADQHVSLFAGGIEILRPKVVFFFLGDLYGLY